MSEINCSSKSLAALFLPMCVCGEEEFVVEEGGDWK